MKNTDTRNTLNAKNVLNTRDTESIGTAPAGRHKPQELFFREICSIITLWNRLYADIMYRLKVPYPADGLYKLLVARIREHGAESVEEAILRIGQSRYLMGQKSTPPASFAWLMQPDIFRKLLTGYYDDFNKPQGGAGVLKPGPGVTETTHLRVHGTAQDVSSTPKPNQGSGSTPKRDAYGGCPEPYGRDTDLDKWLIDQIVHRRMHNLPPAPKDTTDWEAYMSS